MYWRIEMGDIRLKILSGLLMITLLGFVWMQYKVNKQLGKELADTKLALENVYSHIEEANAKQQEMVDQLNQLKVDQWKGQQELRTKLTAIKSKPSQVQAKELVEQINNILICTELTALGEKCE